MRKVLDILIAALWAASAVQQASYTWEAFGQTGGWGSFPGVAGGGVDNQPGGILSKVPVLGPTGTFLGNAANSVANFLGFGPGKVAKLPSNAPSNSQAQRWTRLGRQYGFPPKDQLGYTVLHNTATNGSDAQKQRARNAMRLWASTHHWDKSDVDAYLKYVGL